VPHPDSPAGRFFNWQTESWRVEQWERDELARHIEEVENSLSEHSDQLREYLPNNYLRALYDRQVGRMKGTYGFTKSLVGTAIDAATLLQKVQSPIGWFDPELLRKFRQSYEFAQTLGKAASVWEFGTLDEKKQLLKGIRVLAESGYESAKKSVQEQWAEAKRTGKQEELIEKWKTRILLEVGSLVVGAGELKGASSVAKELEAAEIASDATRAEKAAAEMRAARRAALPRPQPPGAPPLVGAEIKVVKPDIGEKALKDLSAFYKTAPAAKQEIDTLADKIAAEFNGHVAKAPLKSPERALEKIVGDYGGDASRIKDLARNTIVVPAGKEQSALDALLRARPDIDPKTVKILDAAKDPLGYSGINVTVPTQAGIHAEIQINSPEMIYAKERPEIARTILGDDLYNQIASKPGRPPGGLGHEFYEEYRSLPDDSPESDAIAAKSRAYYDAIRR
jgi:hypothetical protein